MREAGLQAYAHRRESKSKIYAYEQAASARVEPDDEAAFCRYKAAWEFFEAQLPGYRHLAIWRIVSAKRAETQRDRLAKLIEASQDGQCLICRRMAR